MSISDPSRVRHAARNGPFFSLSASTSTCFSLIAEFYSAAASKPIFKSIPWLSLVRLRDVTIAVITDPSGGAPRRPAEAGKILRHPLKIGRAPPGLDAKALN
jgi:hypothetical protein